MNSSFQPPSTAYRYTMPGMFVMSEAYWRRLSRSERSASTRSKDSPICAPSASIIGMTSSGNAPAVRQSILSMPMTVPSTRIGASTMEARAE